MDVLWNKAWGAVKAVLRSTLVLAAIAGIGAVVVVRHFSERSGQRQPVRWHDQQGQDGAVEESIRPHVAVYSVPNVKPPHALPTLRDLGDRAQVRAIDAMQAAGPQSHPWDDLRRALDDAVEPGERDPFLFERVLVVTVSRADRLLPGDRMMRTQVTVEPTNFKFAAYTIAATDNETVKVSSVEATDTRKLPSDIGLAFPGLGEAKVGGLPGGESSVRTTSDISSQFEQLGIDIIPSALHITRESGAGGDVVGNTRIALSITTDSVQILNQPVPKVGKPPPDEIVLAVTGLNLEGETPYMDVVPLVPLPHCALMARVQASYDQRHILKGQQFYDESRHDVSFIHSQESGKTVTIAGADDVSPFIWSIQLVPPHEQPDNAWHKGTWHALNAQTGEKGSMRRIVFSDYGRAVKLSHWVRTHATDAIASTPVGSPPAKSGSYVFNYRFRNYHSEDGDFGLAVIKQTGDTCSEQISTPVAEDTMN